MISIQVLRFGIGVFVVCLAFVLFGRAVASDQFASVSQLKMTSQTAVEEYAHLPGSAAGVSVLNARPVA